jgi:dihydrofolate reductase
MSQTPEHISEKEDRAVISLIVAASTNNVIGKNNQLLWRLPADTKFFKNTTWTFPVIMGRKTYVALGKPLSGRYNIVITRDAGFRPEGVTVVNNLQSAIDAAGTAETKEIFIIGGGQIYEQSIPIANRIYITRVHAELEGDAWFPAIDEKLWHLVSSHTVNKDEKHAYDFTFEVWERR